MSDNSHYQATEDAHTGPIKNPKQLLMAVFLGFMIVVLIIVALVAFVVSGLKPSGSSSGQDMALYGVSQEGRDRDVNLRLAKVGAIEIRDANRALALGEVVFKGQCIACHGAPGIPAAPHMGDKSAWAPRLGQGYATLLEHALKGKGAMPPQGGGDFEDVEIGRAVVYMTNASGASFPVPERVAAADAAAAPDGAAAAPGAAGGAAPAGGAAAAPTGAGAAPAAGAGAMAPAPAAPDQAAKAGDAPGAGAPAGSGSAK